MLQETKLLYNISHTRKDMLRLRYTSEKISLQQFSEKGIGDFNSEILFTYQKIILPSPKKKFSGQCEAKLFFLKKCLYTIIWILSSLIILSCRIINCVSSRPFCTNLIYLFPVFFFQGNIKKNVCWAGSNNAMYYIVATSFYYIELHKYWYFFGVNYRSTKWILQNHTTRNSTFKYAS